MVAWYPPVALAAATETAEIDPALEDIARMALSADPASAKPAIEELRRRGQSGLDAMLDADDGSDRASAAVDAIARQRDARASGLYWYTDLKKAKQAAQADGGRPILSLRLLGRLDEELSCANSRFFRTALYANAEVSSYLRERFVLHWSSERAAPKIVVDFGDGRRLERTITGNSIHYVLDQQGRLVDAVPGLYGPLAFMGTLENAARTADEIGSAGAQQRSPVLRDFHRRRIATINRAWAADLAFLGVTSVAPVPDTSNSTSASVALPVAMPKAAAEAPLVFALAPPAPAELEGMTSQPLWTRIAERHAQVTQLDDASRALMHSKRPGLATAALANRAARFQRLMAYDTVKNEYVLHRQIHEWMLIGADSYDMETLNARVYAELFLTPRSDPWIGLAEPDAYTGIENDGLMTSP
jgi:hypothetical protein